MLKIRCSSLEDVKQNPQAYAQLLALTDGKSGGGTYGMFAYWQDAARQVHEHDLTVSQAIKHLQNKFIRFDETPKNKAKQDRLLEQFVKYCRLYDKNNFAFVDSRRHMKWEIHNGVMLTGLTPWVVYNDTGYYSYFVTEELFDWQEQLRFPLIQQYLTDNKIECDITEMHMGIYCLSTNKFDFRSYTERELKDTVSQTTKIFENVKESYLKLKK